VWFCKGGYTARCKRSLEEKLKNQHVVLGIPSVFYLVISPMNYADPGVKVKSMDVVFGRPLLIEVMSWVIRVWIISGVFESDQRLALKPVSLSPFSLTLVTPILSIPKYKY
jgi:hypothetical protein